MATDTTLLQEIKERFSETEEASSDFTNQFKRDMRFRYGDQWEDKEMRKRKERGRPCLTFNRINPTIRSITNDQRQNSPSPEVVPVDSVGDPKTASVIQGMMRYILNHSNSKSAFSTAFEHSTTGGRGFFRILPEYESFQSFNQEIKIKRIINPLSVGFDLHSTEIDGSDAEFAFVSDEMSKDKYKRIYKKSELSSFDSWGSLDNPFVLNDKTVRIAEYFYKKYTDKTLLLLSSGDAVFEDELDQDLLFSQGITVVDGQTRRVSVPSVKWCKTNGIEILEQTDWLGKWIPIIPVYGEEFFLDGKLRYQGMVADARDPQMAFNALSSSEIEAIALAPKAPWLVTPKNIEGLKSVWDRSGENLPYLPFNPDDTGFVPTRQSIEPAIAAISQASFQMADNLKAATGVYDPSLGNQSNETSGVAIRARTMQGQTANYHYQDNLNMSLSHCGRQLVDLIPLVYDAKRAVRTLGDEDDVETIIINSTDPDNDGHIYDLSAGKYDVRIQTGPSYLTKRQEAAASMLEVSKTNPQITGVAGDLIVKAMDWPHAQEISERLRRTIDPKILEEQNGADIPPEVQAQMQQMDQMIQMLTQKVNEQNEEIKTKLLEINSKEKIEAAKLETDLIKEVLKQSAQVAKDQVDRQLAELQAWQQSEAQQFNQNLNGYPGAEQPGARPLNQTQQQPTSGQSLGTFMEE